MFRVFLPASDWQPPQLILQDREAHHLRSVLRAQVGDAVTCFDGQGNEAIGTIAQIDKSQILIDITHQQSDPRANTSVVLCVAMPGQNKIFEIVNQATQLGVQQIVPLLTQRTVVKVPSKDIQKKQDRMLQVAIEAAKQCERAWLPEIAPICTLEALLASDRVQESQCLLAALEGPYAPLQDLLVQPATHRYLFIGPEGDFTPEEMASIEAVGAKRISLGQYVLRTETAVVSALSQINLCLSHENV